MGQLKRWLDNLDFDWKSGRIIYQITNDFSSPGWGTPKEALEIDESHRILTEEFDSGFGGPECPRIIAEDKNFIYFPVQYDGSTWLQKISKNIIYYLSPENPTPYPGG